MTPGERFARVRRLLEQMPDGAAALAGSVANVRWLSGLAGEPHQLYGMAPIWVLTGADGAQRVLAPAGELAWIHERHGLDDVIGYGRFVLNGEVPIELRRAISDAAGRTLTDAVSAAFEAVAADSAQVLLDDGISARDAFEVFEVLKPRPVRISPEVWLQARAVKDPTEIAALKTVNGIAEAGIARALARAEEGVTELDLLRWVRETMIEHGARPLLGSVGIGERGALVDFASSGRALHAGEAIRFDVGCVLDGYHADLARTAVLGDPPSWLLEAHAALVAGEQAMLAALRPGVSAGDLFDAGVAAVRSAGLPRYRRTHCGHGIGLEMYEPARIAADEPRIFEAGNTCCVETPLYLIGRAGVQIEDAVHVTTDGYERLGSLPQELLVAGSDLYEREVDD